MQTERPSSLREDHRVSRALTRRYLIALALVALLTTAAWLSMELVIEKQTSVAAVVNVSGRQRMLSQRISLYSSLLVHSQPEARREIRRHLAAAIDLMWSSHDGLLHGSQSLGLPSRMSSQVRAMYFSPPLALNRQVNNYLRHAEALLLLPDDELSPDNKEFQAVVSAGPTRLVTSLDQMVNQYQAEGDTDIAHIQRAESFVWLLTLLLLSMEAVFIFRPISAQIRSVISRLEALTLTLQKSKDKLDQRVRERTIELEKVAHFDPLTGIPNRRHLTNFLEQEIVRARRRAKSLAVCYLDLDEFKPVNDLYGHEIGDKLLVHVTNRILRIIRADDVLGRLGGDEFALVLTDIAGKEEVTAVLDRLLEEIRDEVSFGSVCIHSSITIGVTLFPEDSADPDTLLRHADYAMYQAKAAGKNRYQFFDPENDRQRQRYLGHLNRMETALEQDEFILFYQPKVNMRTGTVVGVEALIRWQHPEYGLLPPIEFLPFVNGQPLIVRIGDWVLETAMSQIEAWKAAGLNLPISVNVDAAQISRPDFIEKLRQQLAQHPSIGPGDLELEVLESSALEDLEMVSDAIAACRQLGIGFALDDFGAGYSSLLYLKRLPADTLKIDQGFIREMLDNPEDMAILEGILGLSTAFQRKTIAEGVETIEHGQMLLRMDCELAQGFAIAEPMSAERMLVWLAEWKSVPAWTSTKRIRRDYLPALFALVEHRAWIVQLDNYLHGSSDVMPQMDHTQCRFGRWLARNAREHSGHPALQAMEPLHHSVHELARQLIERKRMGQEEDALAKLGDIYMLRDKMIRQIIAFLDEQDLSGKS